MHDRKIDEFTERYTDRSFCEDVRLHLLCLVYLLWHLFAQKYRFPKRDGPTDGLTDGGTDIPGYRDAYLRMELKISYLSNI